MDEGSQLYRSQEESAASHLALYWKGRLRFTVPRDRAAQRTCWALFHPGALEVPLRGMARWPRLFGVNGCVEGLGIGRIRETAGCKSELSCCRAGAAGPWHKDTIVFLEENRSRPLYFVKSGAGAAVDSLLENEAHWLRTLRCETSLAGRVPELIAHRSGEDSCFLVQRPVDGNLEFWLGAPQLDFVRRLQQFSQKTLRYSDSTLCRNLTARFGQLNGRLSDHWTNRLERSIDKTAESFSAAPRRFVAAHNDFTPWNVRVANGVARAFDWEYAADECLPLFDPLHFVLLPMALARRPAESLLRKAQETAAICGRLLAARSNANAQAQLLAYLVNICALYLVSTSGKFETDPVIQSYAGLIDLLVGCKSV